MFNSSAPTSSRQKPPDKRKATSDSDSEDDCKKVRLNDDDDSKTPAGEPRETNAIHSRGKTYRKGGLAHSLHGSIYQLKLQMLFLKRALDRKYEFSLGTEVEDAEKFDDIVFKYKKQDESGKTKIRFVQAKHKQDESYKITANDLKSEDNDFSMQKYFISYREIKHNMHRFRNCELKDLILYTNIDFAELENESFRIINIEETDEILDVTKSGYDTQRVKLIIPKGHDLYEKLRETSDLHVLVKSLKQHILENKPLDLRDVIFKLYHGSLCKNIFDIESKTEKCNNNFDKKVRKKIAKFRADFLNGNNLSDDVSKFRTVLCTALEVEDNQFQTEFTQKTLHLSENFGQILELQADPTITNSNELAETFADYIKKARKEQSYITISRNTNIIKSNINKLAFHILVKDEAQKELVRFRELFFDDNHKLQGNLEEFRAALKTKLKKNGFDFRVLSQHKYKVSKFDVCEETSEGELLYPQNELPKDDVDDVEIEDFFDKLVFAVNQPNEVQLGEIITEEMGQYSQFNLLTANLVSDSFQKKMLDWFKEKRLEKGEEGTWLDAESGRKFFDSIEETVSGLVSIGISVTYPEKLATYGITFDYNHVFEKIKYLLYKESGPEKILHIIAPEKTLLTAINVNSALEVLKQQEELAVYRKNDSYIFLRLSTLLRNISQKYVINAFKLKESYNLLIIECDCTAPERDVLILYKKMSDILLNSSKKLILITNKDITQLDGFGKALKTTTIKDDMRFNNLTKESQVNLLAKEVIFQGQKMCFNEIINMSDEKINEIIDAGIIVKLVEGHKISISSKVNDLGEVNDYYVDRRFRQVIFSKKTLEKYLNEYNCVSDLFIFQICGTESGLNAIYSNTYTFDNFQSAEYKFNELCDRNTETNIHWLKCDSEFLIWYKSRGSISNLVQYKIREVHKTDNITRQPYLLEEIKLVNEYIQHKIVIISDSAGMGKSTVLTHLAMELGKYSPYQWIIRINLNDHTDALEKVFNKKIKFCDMNMVVDFFSNDLLASQEQSTLEKKLFNYSFNNNCRKMTFLFDGFDEISPDYKDVVIDLLQSLKMYKIGNIFVTTRPNMSEELEQALAVFSHVLEPLSKEEQIKFLVKFWTKKLNLVNLHRHTLRLLTYAKSTIEHVSKSINDAEQAFIGIPLQTMMLAEVFQENEDGMSFKWQSCKEFLESELDKPKLPDNFALLDLYEQFAEKKFYRFYLVEKKSRILTRKGERKKANEEYEKFKKKHEVLALQTLFSEKELTELLSPTENQELKSLIEMVKKEGNHDEGFVDQIIDDKPRFIHRTFAEYFASFQIAAKMLATPAKTLQCINHVLINISPIFINSLIKKLDGKQQIITFALEKPLLSFAVIRNHLNFIKSLLKCDCNDWPKKLDTSGKTPLHYAVELGMYDMVKLLLEYANDIYETDVLLKHGSFKKPEYENSKLVKFINILDKDGKTALYYATRKNHLDLAFDLLLRGANIDSLQNDDINKLMKRMLNVMCERDLYHNGILAVYADQDNKYRPIQEKILLKSPGIFNELDAKNQSRILSYFFVHGRLEVIEALLGTITDLVRRKEIINNEDNSFTPLDRVNNSDELRDDERLEITKYLCEHGGTVIRDDSYSIDRQDSERYISGILQAAASRGHINTFKHFIAKENHENYHRHLYVACQYNQHNIIKYLCENYELNMNVGGNTILHTACFSRCPLKIIKYLIDNDNINAENLKGETPLFMAIMVGRKLNVIDYLVTKGANLNWKDKSGNTPLSLAIHEDQKGIIQYLLKQNACISGEVDELTKDKFNYFKDPKKFNVDLVIENGYPRLHSAIKSKNIKWAQFLVRHGADINKVDIEGNTPLYWASQLNLVTVVEFLLQCGAAFRQEDLLSESYGDTKISWLFKVLNKLFSSQNLLQDLNNNLLQGKWAHWGPYGSGHSDAWDGDNPTVHILNARNYKGKTLYHIAADINDEAAMNILFKLNHDYLQARKDYQTFNTRLQDYQSTSIDIKDSQGNTPLHLAAQKGHYGIARWLLKNGTTFNSENLQRETAEIIATNNKHNNIVELLQPTKNLFIAIEEKKDNILEVENCVKKETYINAKNQCYQTSLHLAAYLGQFLVLHSLLDNGADIEAIDLNKNTPLHMAAEKDEIKNVRVLLKHGAIYNAKNINDRRPFDLAQGESRILLGQIDTLFKDIQSDNLQIAISNIAIMQNSDEIDISNIINIRDNEANTLLHFAAELGESDIVELLLKHGAMFNSKNKMDKTPKDLTHNRNINILLETIGNMFENIDNVRIFYQEREKLGTQIITNVRDCQGKTLLYRAADLYKWDIVEYLVEKGAKINLMDVNYSKVIKYYSNFNLVNLKIIKYLIDNGDINATNYKRETPLFMAIRARSDLDIIEYLVSKGSNVNWEDLCGNTPLSLAVESDETDIIHYLLNKNASISEKASQWIKDNVGFFKDSNQCNFDVIDT